MSLFNKLKKATKDSAFDIWLNNIFAEPLSADIKAICFNLYDDGDNKWSIEFVGTSSFDENNTDWACNEVFTTRDNPFVLIREYSWKDAENLFTEMVSEYLKGGKYANKLKAYTAIGIGFVDGDLNIIYKK
ncbi:MAG: hypothetical protein K2H13_08875 [Eubacterium sp.]|nr:hypothetical protein [Eubacterium sp.]MDE6767155.1 hypothetical protein [Eubacterium sp.]